MIKELKLPQYDWMDRGHHLKVDSHFIKWVFSRKAQLDSRFNERIQVLPVVVYPGHSSTDWAVWDISDFRNVNWPAKVLLRPCAAQNAKGKNKEIFIVFIVLIGTWTEGWIKYFAVVIPIHMIECVHLWALKPSWFIYSLVNRH